MTSAYQLRAPLVACVAALLAGCTSMSGLDGSSSYACKAPEGVTCDSVAGTYANAIHDNLPSQHAKAAGATRPEASASASASAPAASRNDHAQRAIAPAPATTPLRSSARILRLWFKPWEDADHDLYDQGYVYVQIDSGQWLVEHVQRQIREAYTSPNRPLRPPPQNATKTGESRKDNSAPLGSNRPPPQPSAENPFPGPVPPTSRSESTD